MITFLAGCLEGLTGYYNGPEANIDKELSLALPGQQVEFAHPYCTEFIVKNCALAVDDARRLLEDFGESLIAAANDNMLKVHIHTAHPGKVLECALTWGSLHNIEIDNMADQHSSSLPAPSPKKALSVIAVAAGPGLAEIMRNLGADIIISGGQTMNPPVEDFVTAVHQGAAEQYILLPNNKNIMLAARQAQKLLGERVHIVPAKNHPQGLAALTAFDADAPVKVNLARMQARLEAVGSASITVAVRDSIVAGQMVPAGHFIGIINGKVEVSGDNLPAVLTATVKKLATKEAEVVSLYYGADVTRAQAEQLVSELQPQVSAMVIELYAGGQPHYHFLISVE